MTFPPEKVRRIVSDTNNHASPTGQLTFLVLGSQESHPCSRGQDKQNQPPPAWGMKTTMRASSTDTEKKDQHVNQEHIRTKKTSQCTQSSHSPSALCPSTSTLPQHSEKYSGLTENKKVKGYNISPALYDFEKQRNGSKYAFARKHKWVWE